MPFRHESLRVWPLALEYVDACFIVADNLPQRFQFSIGEQLRRAATSIIANIAEGSAKSTQRSERNFYDIARGPLAETVGLLALCQRRQYLDDDRHERMYNRANILSSMLYGLIKSNESKTIAEAGAQYIFSNDNLEDFFLSSFLVTSDIDSSSHAASPLITSDVASSPRASSPPNKELL